MRYRFHFALAVLAISTAACNDNRGGDGATEESMCDLAASISALDPMTDPDIAPGVRQELESKFDKVESLLEQLDDESQLNEDLDLVRDHFDAEREILARYDFDTVVLATEGGGELSELSAQKTGDVERASGVVADHVNRACGTDITP